MPSAVPNGILIRLKQASTIARVRAHRLALEQSPPGQNAQHRAAEQEQSDHVQQAVNKRRRIRRQDAAARVEERDQEESGNQVDRRAGEPQDPEQPDVAGNPTLDRHEGDRTRRLPAAGAEALVLG